jgi:hypothetical protein
MSLSGKIQLREGEVIVDTIRPSAVNFLGHYILAFAILFLSAFLLFWLASQGWYGAIVLTAGALAGIVLLFEARRLTRKNYWILTTERLVDVDRSSLFNESIAVVEIAEARDVRIRKKGIGSFVFGLGDLVIDVQDGDYVLVLKGVRDANTVLNLIGELTKENIIEPD